MGNRPGMGRIILAVIVIAAATFFFLRKTDHCDRTRELDSLVLKAAGQAGVGPGEDMLYTKEETIRAGRHTFLRIERHFMVKPDFKAEGFLKSVEKGCERTGFRITKYAFEEKGEAETFTVSFALKKKELYKVVFSKGKYALPSSSRRGSGRIAIVLDDLGYNTENLEAILSIKAPLTLSVLPNLPYSDLVAKEAADRDIEIILHMPMEPHNGELRLEEGTIMVDMADDEVRGLLAKAIDSVSGAKGVSNHMGSRATEDPGLMKVVFNELKKRGMYFLDNLVTDKSACADAAKKAGVRYASRRVFLDNISDEDYIEQQVFQTADIARRAGWAVGVGHDRETTVKVLARVIPQLEESGLRFVRVSELAD